MTRQKDVLLKMKGSIIILRLVLTVAVGVTRGKVPGACCNLFFLKKNDNRNIMD